MGAASAARRVRIAFAAAVLQIPHVGGVPLLIRFRGTRGTSCRAEVTTTGDTSRAGMPSRRARKPTGKAGTKPRPAEMLASTVITLIDMGHNFRRRRGLEARNRIINEFSLDRTSAQYAGVYEALFERARQLSHPTNRLGRPVGRVSVRIQIFCQELSPVSHCRSSLTVPVRSSRMRFPAM